MFSKKKAVEPLFFNSRDSVFFNLSGQQVSDTDVSSSAYIASALPSLSLLRAVIELPKNVPEEAIDEMLLEAAYDQLGLSLEDDYVMQYQRRKGYDSSQHEYDVFLMPHTAIEERLGVLRARYPYVDCVIPYIMLPQMLYKRGLISSKGGQVFIHVGDDDSFFILFDEGEMIYSKSLDIKIGNLRNIFVEQSGLDLDRDEFIKYLSGRAADHESYDGAMSVLYRMMYNEIEEALSFARRIHPNVRIDILYLDASARFKDEFFHYLSDMLMLPCKPVSSLISHEHYLRDSCLMMLGIYYLQAILGGDNLPNFTIYKRPPPFLKRDGGIVTIFMGLSLIVSLGYPLSSIYQWFVLNNELKEVNQQSYEYEEKAASYKRELDTLKVQRDELEKSIEAREKMYSELETSLRDIYKWQSEYVDKSKIFDEFLKSSLKNHIAIEHLMINDSNSSVVLEANATAKEQRNFSGFLKNLGESGQYYEVSTKEINQEGGRYRSVIKAVIR
ncbi:MAG: hypothetical protein ACTTJS_05645 [Wolinella sp.]